MASCLVRKDLDVKTNFDRKSLLGIDIAELVASIRGLRVRPAHRAWLKIPRNTPFEVRPRLDLTKLYWHRDTERTVREVLFKVSWSEMEDNHSGGGWLDSGDIVPERPWPSVSIGPRRTYGR